MVFQQHELFTAHLHSSSSCSFQNYDVGSMKMTDIIKHLKRDLQIKGNLFWCPPPFQMNLALSAFRTQWEGDRPSRAAHKNQPYVFTLHCAWQFTQLEFMQKPGKIIREKIPWSAEMEESPHSWSLSTYICSISCTTQTGSTNHMDSVAEDKIQNLLSHEVRRKKKKKRKWHRQAENLNILKSSS